MPTSSSAFLYGQKWCYRLSSTSPSSLSPVSAISECIQAIFCCSVDSAARAAVAAVACWWCKRLKAQREEKGEKVVSASLACRLGLLFTPSSSFRKVCYWNNKANTTTITQRPGRLRETKLKQLFYALFLLDTI